MSGDADDAPARYVFRATVRLDTSSGVSADPERFETVVSRAADPPGEAGWMFFREMLWRGAVADEAHARRWATEALGVPVESVSFSELQTSEAYFEALKTAIAADLDPFNADSVTEVISKYLGSSVRVE